MTRHLMIDFLFGTVAAAFVFCGCSAKAENYFEKGVAAFEKGNYSQSVEELLKAVDADNKNTEYIVYLGMAQMNANDLQAAKESFELAVTYDDECKGAYRGLGILKYRQSDFEGAIKYFSQAMDLAGKKTDETDIDVLRYYGDCCYETGDYEQAVEIYTDVIKDGSNSVMADAYYRRGCAYVKLDDENNAALDFEKSLDYEDDNYGMCCGMYQIFCDAGYTERGESFLRRMLSAEHDELLAGKIYYKLGEYDKAAENLTIAYDNGESEAAYYLALTYEATGDDYNADNLYQEYLGKHPSDAYIYNQYGAYLIGLRKYDKAIVYLEAGLDIGDEDVNQSLLYNQAVCYEYLRDFDKAKTLFEEYLNKYPGDKKARKEYEFISSR